MAEGFHEESWVESVVGGARNPLNWTYTSEQLKRSSDVLRDLWLEGIYAMPARNAEIHSRIMSGEEVPPPDPSVGGSALLLAGYAIENLLKALVIAADPGRVREDTGFVDWGGNGHDLTWLASEAHVRDMTPEERKVILHLTEFTLWAGRYPVALKASAMRPRPTAEHGGAQFTDAMFPVIDRLVERLKERVVAAAKHHSESDAEATAERKVARRMEILAELDVLRKEQLGPGVIFVNDDAEVDPGQSLSCRKCGVLADLNSHTPAVICGCGVLWHGEHKGVAGRVMHTVENYPPPASSPDSSS